MNKIQSIIDSLLNNVIYTAPTILFYLLLSFLSIKIIFNRYPFIFKIRIFIFWIFGIFSNKLYLIHLINRIHRKNKYIDINITLWTSLYSQTNTTISSSSYGTSFTKPICFRCYIDEYTNNLICNIININPDYYQLKTKVISLSTIIPFRNGRLIDYLVKYYIRYDINLIESVVSSLMKEKNIWDISELSGLQKVYNDQINNII